MVGAKNIRHSKIEKPLTFYRSIKFEHTISSVISSVQMSRRFKGTSVALDAPERLLPTESTGIDLREARSQNRPGFGDDRPRRDFGGDDRPRRDFGGDDRPRRDFGGEDRPRRDFGGEERPRRDFGEDGPRRTFSRRTEDSAPAAESDDDWRGGAARTQSAVAPRRFGDSAELGERRQSRRSVEEKEDTAADLEDDWRAGSAPRPSAFADRRTVSRRDDEEAPRRFGSRREEDESAPRRFASRRVEETRADDEDWRRPSREVSTDEPVVAKERMERTRSARVPAVMTRADDDDWRTVRPAAAPVVRRTSPKEEAVVLKARKPVETPAVVQAKTEEATWSSDDEVEVEEKPDMEKISKFAGKVAQYIAVSASEDVVKKIDSITKKIPANFGKPELSTFEPIKAVLALVLDQDKLTSEQETSRLVSLIAPICLVLEEQFLALGGSVTTFQLNIVEEVQRFVAALGCPRLSPEAALVELLWLALYEQGVVCEEVFTLWLDSDEFESPSKSVTLFQTEALRAWLYEFELPGVDATLRKAPAATSDKDEWSSDDDSDIEALVPKRIGGIHLRTGAVAPLRR